MEDLEVVRQWLLSYPKWDAGGPWYIDDTPAVPGCVGLFPMGLEELSRKTDVRGNVRTRNRYTLALYKVVGRDEDRTQDAAWLLEFQAWVQDQSARGLAPLFGGYQQVRAEKGRRKEPDRGGCGMYSLLLTFEFSKEFKEE